MGQFLTGALQAGNSYAAQGAPIQNQNLSPLLDTTMGNYNQTFGNENELAKALIARISGTAPTPADMALKEATQAGIQQGAGQLSSIRGMNPALAQRLIAQNTAGATQKAAGQGALMKSQEQLAAEGELQNLYGTQGGQTNTMYSTLQNANAAQNNANVGMTSNMNNVNAGVSAQNAATAGGLAGGLMSGISSAVGSLFYEGGVVKARPKGYADGGQVSNWGYNDMPMVDNNASMAMTSKYIDSGGEALRKGISGMMKPGPKTPMDMSGTGQFSDMPMAGGAGDAMSSAGPASAGAGMAGDIGMMAMAYKGGSIPAHFHHIAHIYHGGLAAKGGKVPGKAPVPGPVDTPKNDRVPAMLSAGEVVLPNSVTKSANPAEAAKAFMASELRKGGGNEHGDFHEALKRAIISRGKK